MSINENVMAQGSFEIQLSTTVPFSLWRKLDMFGHIVVFPQHMDPNQIGNDAALLAARYAGPVLEKDTSGESIVLRGCGMTWWLGDDQDNGPIIETEVSLNNATLSAALAAVLPDSVTVGTVNNTGTSNFTGDFQWVTPLEAVRSICYGTGAEFKVNPNGTLDAGTKNNVYVIDQPNVVVVRRGYGSDSSYTGVPVEKMRSWLNGRNYVTKVTSVLEKPDGSTEFIADSTRADDHLDVYGNPFRRSMVVRLRGENPIAMATYTLSALNASTIEENQEISTEHYELTGGSFSVGDAFYAFDPPVFEDPDNQIVFRGDVITPRAIRLTAASWPLRDGMGVWYRPSKVADPEWIDLTRFVVWEGEGSEFL